MGTVLLAKPRGYCAGVDRAVQTVEHALEHYGAPIYVRHQIGHNLHVVRSLEAKGAIFVDENDEVPDGATVIFSAHGVSPAVHAQAEARQLKVIDATCPLVTKVHHEVRRYAEEGYEILLIGHAGHEEVVGTSGEAPGQIVLVESPEAAETVQVRDPDRVVWLSQTTLSVDETMQTVEVLRRRFPNLASPPSDDICYATQNRQSTVKAIAPQVELFLVVGSSNSSNSQRMVEVALASGAPTRTWSRTGTPSRRAGSRECARWGCPRGRRFPRSWSVRSSSGWPNTTSPTCARSTRSTSG
jgi:4-hydroxy-3-methylbut-2-enyl diphosphate reductase